MSIFKPTWHEITNEKKIVNLEDGIHHYYDNVIHLQNGSVIHINPDTEIRVEGNATLNVHGQVDCNGIVFDGHGILNVRGNTTMLMHEDV